MAITTIAGIITKDPKIKQLNNNYEVLTFSIQDNKDYFYVDFYSKNISDEMKNIVKDNIVKCVCTISNNNYVDKNNKKHYGYKFKCIEEPLILHQNDIKDNDFNYETNDITY